MSIVKELNELAEKITGENPKEKTIGKSLDYIEQNYTAGGGSGSGGSSAGSDLFVITGTNNGGTYTIDKTYQEINEAYEQNKILLLVLDVYTIFLSREYDYEAEEPELIFLGRGIIINVINNNLYCDTIIIKQVEGVTLTRDKYILTPASN